MFLVDIYKSDIKSHFIVKLSHDLNVSGSIYFPINVDGHKLYYKNICSIFVQTLWPLQENKVFRKKKNTY